MFRIQRTVTLYFVSHKYDLLSLTPHLHKQWPQNFEFGTGNSVTCVTHAPAQTARPFFSIFSLYFCCIGDLRFTWFIEFDLQYKTWSKCFFSHMSLGWNKWVFIVMVEITDAHTHVVRCFLLIIYWERWNVSHRRMGAWSEFLWRLW